MVAPMITAAIEAGLLAADEDFDAFCAHYGIRVTQSFGGWKAEALRAECLCATQVDRKAAVFGLLDMLISR